MILVRRKLSTDTAYIRGKSKAAFNLSLPQRAESATDLNLNPELLVDMAYLRIRPMSRHFIGTVSHSSGMTRRSGRSEAKRTTRLGLRSRGKGEPASWGFLRSWTLSRHFSNRETRKPLKQEKVAKIRHGGRQNKPESSPHSHDCKC